MFHPRRLLHCVLFFGIVFQCSFFLWKRRGEIFSSEHSSSKVIFGNTSEGSEGSTGTSDCVETKSVVGIEPFLEFRLSANNIDGDSDMLRTHDWWDLWNGDSNCTRHQVYLLKAGSEPETGAFVSFPGSGNSWIRSLLMGITGVYVTSVYTDEARFFRPDIPEANSSSYEIPIDCGCSLLQKTHDFSLAGNLYRTPRANLNKTLNSFKGKGILLIRNPFKAIQSYLNFIYGGMKGTAPRSAYNGEEWDNFVSQSVAAWETLNSVWIRGLKRGGVIYYERLRHEPRSELLRLVTMLGLDYDKDRLDCVLRHSKDNSFKRQATNKHVIDKPYTASQRLLIHKAIENVQSVLNERGLEPLPLQYYDLFNNIPEYGIPTQ